MDPTNQPPQAKDGNSSSTPELPAEEKRKNAALSKQRAAAFGEIVALLMRSPQHKPLRLKTVIAKLGAPPKA